jgi:hypothetical protein
MTIRHSGHCFAIRGIIPSWTRGCKGGWRKRGSQCQVVRSIRLVTLLLEVIPVELLYLVGAYVGDANAKVYH